jgi:hypothetical protein
MIARVITTNPWSSFHSIHNKLINHANNYGHSSEQYGIGVDLMAFGYDPYIRHINLQEFSYLWILTWLCQPFSVSVQLKDLSTLHNLTEREMAISGLKECSQTCSVEY